ncbi:IclR family transcriptional regulator [Deltaproteobacteria bacterium]|nr:IclR family transcriptional regulator [Deltaproteobacteria bacterium]
MKSLRKTLDLIEIIADVGNAGVRELSTRTNYPPATVHRIITTLAERGYLRQNPKNRHYSLSTIFLQFADSVRQQFDLIAISRPHLEHLGADTGENVNLCVLDDFVVVYIDHIHSQKHTLQTFTRLGARVPLYATGVGKVYLSRMEPDELNNYLGRIKLERFTDKTITKRKDLLQELSLIRNQGYSIDNEEKEQGVRCVAAPIFRHNGLIKAAISLSGATQWVTMERIESLAEAVIKCAEKISSELGFK